MFREGVLVFAGKVKIPTMWKDLQEGMRWQNVAEAIVLWAREHDCIFVDTVVYERPQIYAAAKSKGDPNDLIALAAIGAAVACWYQRSRIQPNDRVLIQTPTPAQWAGQIPKATKGSAIDSPRALRILSRLTDLEKSRVPNQHDAIDAIGLGLHALGRLGIRRVYTSG